VVALGPLDVPVLYHLCQTIVEKTSGNLELIGKYFTDFSAMQLQQLRGLEELYHSWNAKINVISRKDMDGLYEKHVLHSLSIAAAFAFPKGLDVIDIGTGGGFPGIPLAIFFPDSNFHLVDAIGKKIKVVEAIAKAIGLTNVTVEHNRAEKINNRQFDVAVSRAVAPLKELWTWSKPLLRKIKTSPTDGQIAHGLICLKGGDLALEISQCACRPRILKIHDLFAEAYFEEKYLLQIPKP
jgi:16S rRNA (guanine527-N7)-methyltransferase